jgi:hypothetical protein
VAVSATGTYLPPSSTRSYWRGEQMFLVVAAAVETVAVSATGTYLPPSSTRSYWRGEQMFLA